MTTNWADDENYKQLYGSIFDEHPDAFILTDERHVSPREVQVWIGEYCLKSMLDGSIEEMRTKLLSALKQRLVSI